MNITNLTERELGQIVRTALTQCTPIVRTSGVVVSTINERQLPQQMERKVNLYGRGNR